MGAYFILKKQNKQNPGNTNNTTTGHPHGYVTEIYVLTKFSHYLILLVKESSNQLRKWDE